MEIFQTFDNDSRDSDHCFTATAPKSRHPLRQEKIINTFALFLWELRRFVCLPPFHCLFRSFSASSVRRLACSGPKQNFVFLFSLYSFKGAFSAGCRLLLLRSTTQKYAQSYKWVSMLFSRCWCLTSGCSHFTTSQRSSSEGGMTSEKIHNIEPAYAMCGAVSHPSVQAMLLWREKIERMCLMSQGSFHCFSVLLCVISLLSLLPTCRPRISAHFTRSVGLISIVF